MIRANINWSEQLGGTSILEAMMVLKKAWGEVSEQAIRDCFRKSRILLEAQEGAMDDHDDQFKGMVDDGEDDSAVYKLEFDLNQFSKASPDLAPENLDAAGPANLDHCLLTKLSPNTFHNLLKLLKMAEVTRMRFSTNPYHYHHKMKLTRQLKS